MNSRTLQDVLRGCYGRKVAYTDAEKITPDNIISVLGKCIGVFNLNKTAIAYLWHYYKGDQPIRYRHKIVRDDIVNKIVEGLITPLISLVFVVFMDTKNASLIRGRIKSAIQRIDGQISEEDRSMSTRKAFFSFVNIHRSRLFIAVQNKFKKRQFNKGEEGKHD